MKKVFVFCGHPDTESMCHQFAEMYALGARKTGNEVRQTNLCDMRFDPILHHGYKVIQSLEPDLIKFQEDIRWCDHFVIIYPSWWSTMPALLKGVFDRTWMPGFAFHFGHSHFMWERLLKGRTATVFVTSDSQPFVSRILFGDNVNEIRDGILWFAGFKAKVKKIGPMKNLSPKKKENWIKWFQKLGEKIY